MRSRAISCALNRFNPRAPRGARHRWLPGLAALGLFQSARPARGATRWTAASGRWRRVSIRAPRAGRDLGQQAHRLQQLVSIRAPRAGRDISSTTIGSCVTRFNPRAPRGARQDLVDAAFAELEFQSARPARGATAQSEQHLAPAGVSIRAPRAGRDPPRTPSARAATCFNPRAPRGARQELAQDGAELQEFQSARPARGATFVLGRVRWIGQVSIRAPRAGRDLSASPANGTISGFNPRAPRGARHLSDLFAAEHAEFQSARPARGATGASPCGATGTCRFNPRAPRGARLMLPGGLKCMRRFQSARPARGATDLRRGGSLVEVVSIRAPRAGRDDGPW